MNPEAMRAHAGDAARLLRALANDKRLVMLCLLVEGERSVGELNARVELSQSALSQHLAKLRALDLVETRRDRQMIYYSCKSEAARELLRMLEGIFGEGDLSQMAYRLRRAGS